MTFAEFNKSWQSTKLEWLQKIPTSGNSYILISSSKNKFFTTMSGKASIHSGRSRIFLSGVHQLPKVLLFCIFFTENCMKMKEFGPPGGHASLASPLRSANDSVWLVAIDTYPEVVKKLNFVLLLLGM